MYKEKCVRFHNMSDMKYIEAVMNNEQDAEECFIEDFIKEKICEGLIRKYFGPQVNKKEETVTAEDLAHDIYSYLKERNWKELKKYKGKNGAKLSTYMYPVISRFLSNSYGHIFEWRKILAKMQEEILRVVLSDEDSDEKFDIEDIVSTSAHQLDDSLAHDETESESTDFLHDELDTDEMRDRQSYNESKNSHKKQQDKINKTAKLLSIELSYGKTYNPEPEKDFIQRENYNEIASLLNIVLDKVLGEDSCARLTNIEKKCIRLKCMADLSSKEVGELLGKTEKNVDAITSRARNKMRKYLESEGLHVFKKTLKNK